MNRNEYDRVTWESAVRDVVRSSPSNHLQSLKEAARHGLHATGLIGLLHRYRARQGFKTRELLKGNPRESFTAAYRDGGWVHSTNQESRSGIGSSTAATAGLFARLVEVMRRLGCTSLVDVGCGDWNWMRHEVIDFDYTGIDIVPDLIAANGPFERANVRFRVVDAIHEPVPAADLALCREVLFHLSFAHGRAVLQHMAATCRYVAATTDLDLWCNADIQSGDFRRINLLRRPYRLPDPLCLIPDQGVCPARYLAVWNAADIPR